MQIVCIAKIFIRIAFVNKRKYKPDEKHQWNYNGHDHIPYLITQVHKDRNNVIRFGQCKNTNQSFKTKNKKIPVYIAFMKGV